MPIKKRRQQHFWRRSSDFGLTKKTRNSDSLTSDFHSGCKNYEYCKIWKEGTMYD